MTFVEDDIPTQKETINPTWDYILNSLQSIHPHKKAYFILTNNNSSYVQCTGDEGRLCIELRVTTGDSFKHYVIGKSQNRNTQATTWTKIHSKVGPVTVHDNEVCSITDAITIFESFYQERGLPILYNKRNITKQFT